MGHVKTRFWFILFFLMVSLPARCGDQTDVQVICRSGAPLRFAVYPFLDRLTLRERLQPLLNYLASGTGRPVLSLIASDYTQLEQLLKRKQAHLCWYSPRRSHPTLQELGLRAICRPALREGEGYRGVIVARQKSGKKCLTDLRGCRFAYIDRQSNSGFLYPNRLLAENGLSPLDFFGEIHFAGTHDSALLGVVSGIYDAAAVTDMVLERGPLTAAEREQLVVLATTSAILPDVIAVSETLDPALQKRIEQLLLGLSEMPTQTSATRDMLGTLGFTGFVPITEGP